MFFGKRNAAAATPAGDAPIMQQRAFPAELWQGEMGDLLRQTGMGPDDESNLVPTEASIEARIARDRAAHEAKLAELNRDVAQRTGGGSVTPFFLFGDPIWNSEVGTFLMTRLRFYPYEDWNVVFLPADERTAKIMNAPVCPNGHITGSVELVEGWYRDAKAKLDAAHARANRTHQFAPIIDVERDIKADVWGLAAFFANYIGARWQPPQR